MQSIWKEDVKFEERNPLPGDTVVKNLVIGAGMAGILIAWFLQQKGQEVIIVEANRIAGGQTGNTTAKITSQHDLRYDKMLKTMGEKQARQYITANEKAIRSFERIIEEKQILCHFERKPAILYTKTEAGIKELQMEMEAVRKLGIDAFWIDENQKAENSDRKENCLGKELPFDVKAAVCFPRQAQFHPLEFLAALTEELVIYERTKVLSVKKNKAYTDRGVIEADNIIFATHYPVTNMPGFYFLRQHQERSYVLALAGQKALEGMYYGIEEDGLSLRSAGDYLLLGGGGHRTGKCLCRQKKGELLGYTFLQAKAKQYYPKAEIAFAWSAQDCMPHDKLPFIGSYSIFRPHWFVATGFQKWGMTTSILAAEIISNQICKSMPEEENLFSPKRFYVRAGCKDFLSDVWESLVGLCKGLFKSKRKRCPHMGCKLSWNREDSRWECSCHGSAFSEDGMLKDNPAQIDLKL